MKRTNIFSSVDKNYFFNSIDELLLKLFTILLKICFLRLNSI